MSNNFDFVSDCYVQEDRGCGISYNCFEGTAQQCQAYIDSLVLTDDDVNGNGEPFTYSVELIYGDSL